MVQISRTHFVHQLNNMSLSQQISAGGPFELSSGLQSFRRGHHIPCLNGQGRLQLRARNNPQSPQYVSRRERGPSAKSWPEDFPIHGSSSVSLFAYPSISLGVDPLPHSIIIQTHFLKFTLFLEAGPLPRGKSSIPSIVIRIKAKLSPKVGLVLYTITNRLFSLILITYYLSIALKMCKRIIKSLRGAIRSSIKILNVLML